MDHPSYHQPPNNPRRSQKMETASFILGILSVTTLCVVYPALICGSLSIVFALLSKGGEDTLTSKAKIGLITGCVALGFILVIFLYTIIVANLFYGGIENMLIELYNNMGLDYKLRL